MEVEVAHFVDAGEQDAHGEYDYYYEGDLYTFRESDRQLVARTYVEDRDSVVFVEAVNNLRNFELAWSAARYFLPLGRTVFFGIGPSGGYEPWTPPVLAGQDDDAEGL